jgi:hypothetical protein
MSKSPQSANRVTRLYGVPSRSLRVDFGDRRDIGHDGLTLAPRLDGTDARSQPSVVPAMARPDRQDTTPWSSSILASLHGGFCVIRRVIHRCTKAFIRSVRPALEKTTEHVQEEQKK